MMSERAHPPPSSRQADVPGAIDSWHSTAHSSGSPVDSARTRDHLVEENGLGWTASRRGQPQRIPKLWL